MEGAHIFVSSLELLKGKYTLVLYLLIYKKMAKQNKDLL